MHNWNPQSCQSSKLLAANTFQNLFLTEICPDVASKHVFREGKDIVFAAKINVANTDQCTLFQNVITRSVFMALVQGNEKLRLPA